jgi:hypothetical protein
MMFPLNHGLLAAGGLKPTNYEQLILSRQPAHYWRLNETDGATAFDLAGGMDGAYTDGAVLNQGALVVGGGSAVFDGTNYVDLGIWNPGGSFTAEVWFSSTQPLAGIVRIFDHRGQGTFGTGVPGFAISPEDAGWKNTSVEADNGESIYDLASSGYQALLDGNPHHVALVYNDETGNLALYIDGDSIGSITDSDMIGLGAAGSLSTTRSMNLARANTASQYFTGRLAEAAIYDYALTPTAILGNYTMGIGV